MEIFTSQRSAVSSGRRWYISLFSVDFLSSSRDFCSALTFVFGDVFLPNVCVWRCVCLFICLYLCVCMCVCVCVCCRTGENKSPAVVLISSSFVSALRDQLSALGLPLQLHLLPTIITPFNGSTSQTAACRPSAGSNERQKRVSALLRTKLASEWKECLGCFHTQQVCNRESYVKLLQDPELHSAARRFRRLPGA